MSSDSVFCKKCGNYLGESYDMGDITHTDAACSTYVKAGERDKVALERLAITEYVLECKEMTLHDISSAILNGEHLNPYRRRMTDEEKRAAQQLDEVRRFISRENEKVSHMGT